MASPGRLVHPSATTSLSRGWKHLVVSRCAVARHRSPIGSRNGASPMTASPCVRSHNRVHKYPCLHQPNHEFRHCLTHGLADYTCCCCSTKSTPLSAQSGPQGRETPPRAFLVHIHTYGGQQGSHKAINYLYCLSGPNPIGLDPNCKLQQPCKILIWHMDIL